MPVPLTKESDVDVLIIGAGPAGLMCAKALANFNVNVGIVEQRPAKVPAGQTDGIQARMIEEFQSYGLAERLLRKGNQMHRAGSGPRRLCAYRHDLSPRTGVLQPLTVYANVQRAK